MTAPLVLTACRTMVVLSCAWTVSTLHSGLTPMPSPALLSRATGQKRPLVAGRLGDPTPLCCWSPVDCWQRTCIVSWVFVGAQRTVTPVIITPGHTGLGLCATVSTVLSRCVPCLPNGSFSMSLSHTLISLWNFFSSFLFFSFSFCCCCCCCCCCCHVQVAKAEGAWEERQNSTEFGWWITKCSPCSSLCSYFLVSQKQRCKWQIKDCGKGQKI